MIALLADRRIQIVILVVAALLVANYSGLLTLLDDNVRYINSESELTDGELIALDSILVEGEAGEEDSAISIGLEPFGIEIVGNSIWVIDGNDALGVCECNMDGSGIGCWQNDIVQNKYSDLSYSGNIFWITDGTTNKVYKYTISGILLKTITLSDIDKISGIATDGSFLWVGNKGNKEIQKYTLTGTYISSFDISSIPKRMTTYGGYIWYAATDYWIYKYSTDGNYESKFSPLMDTTESLATNGEFIWVGEEIGTNIHKYYMDGSYTGTETWVLPNVPIKYGFTEYVGMGRGKQIKATLTTIEAEVPLILPMDMDFTVTVNIGEYTDSDITLTFYNSFGGVVNTFEGNPPSIQVNNIDGTLVDSLVITAERDGVTQSKSYNMEFEDLGLIVNQPGYYEYGHTVHIDVSFNPDVGNEIATIQLKNENGQILEEYADMMPTIELTRPKAIGNTEIHISVTYRGIDVVKSFWVFFEGEPVITTVHTESYVQYDTNNIVFDITVQNVLGEYLSDVVLSDIAPICSLSDGNILESSWNYVGNGVYRVSSRAIGTGNFIGKLKFKYMNEFFISDPISINIKENKLSIGTGEIPPSGIRGVPLTVIVTVYDAEGQLTDPDTIYATAKKPDGWSTEQISYDEFTKVSVGRYSFGYTADQLEKFTFEITAEKSGLTKGFTSASILFASAEGEADITAPTDSMLSMLIEYWYIILILLIAAVILIWRFR